MPYMPGCSATNARGRRAILIIDEAQNLDPQVLEQLRLLTNLETSTRKLLQIILIGQPESRRCWPGRRCARSRSASLPVITSPNSSASEVKAYVDHRLRVAGASATIFPAALSKRLFRATHGVPRLINLVSDRALLGAYVQGQQQVSVPILRQAIREVLATGAPQQHTWLDRGRPAGAGGAGIYVGTGQGQSTAFDAGSRPLPPRHWPKCRAPGASKR